MAKRKCKLCNGKGIIGPFGAGMARPLYFPCSLCRPPNSGRGLAPETKALGVPEILEEMARTFRERNKQYGDNWRMVGKLMAIMFPAGVHLRAAEDYDVWHLFELLIVKLSRFAIGKLEHEDSIHDLAVYAAMIEAILKQRKEKRK